MRAFGARGYLSPEQLKKMNAFLAQCRRDRQVRMRAQIAALSDLDIRKIMASVLVIRAAASGSVERADFLRAGIPDHRIDKNRDAAFRLARKLEPKLDAMGGLQ
jgi:hypothetical protein